MLEEEATRMAKADKALRQQIRMVKRKARREQGRLRRKNRLIDDFSKTLCDPCT